MRVLVLTGAGVSAESGIPTFRGKDGYWKNLDPTKLANPEAFARDPQLVWEWYGDTGSVRARSAISLGLVSRAAAAHPQCATERRARSDRATCPPHRGIPARYAERGRSARARWNTGTKDGANSWRHLRHPVLALRFYGKR